MERELLVDARNRSEENPRMDLLHLPGHLRDESTHAPHDVKVSSETTCVSYLRQQQTRKTLGMEKSSRYEAEHGKIRQILVQCLMGRIEGKKRKVEC